MIKKFFGLLGLVIWDYSYRLNNWLFVAQKDLRKAGRKVFRKIFTFAIKFLYKYPTLYEIADSMLPFMNSPEWRKISGELIGNNGKILELGSGCFPAIKQGVLLDYSISLLQAAPTGFLKIHSSANVLPFKDKTFNFAMSVFPPGIAADEGFFQEEKFWREIHRVLSDDGQFISLIYIKYKSWLPRLISKIFDPLVRDFWDNLGKITAGFEITSHEQFDSDWNRLVFVTTIKKR